jgi:dihydroorotase
VSTIVIREGRVIDPANQLDAPLDVVIADGKIVAVGAGAKAPGGAVEISGKGLWVVPGFIDLRCKVTAAADVADAVKGGYTTLVSTWDSEALAAPIRILRAGSLTRLAAGEELGDVPDGAPCLSDGFTPVSRAGLMRRALQYLRPLNTVLMVHAEDLTLSGKGVLGEGFEATRLGLLPVPASAETVAVARDMMLLEEIGGRLHFAHLT